MKRIFFIMGVLLLGLGFLLSSCGYGPQTKTVAEKGAYAVEFPVDNPYNKYISAGGDENFKDSDITVEAWIKTNGGDGTIFAHSTAILGVDAATGFARFTIDGATTATGTTIVNDGSWHHVAGVLVGERHEHTPTTICNATAMSGIHVDIYVDGVWEECNVATFPVDIDTCVDPKTCEVISCPNIIGRDLVGTNPSFTGTIDEVRVWKEARDKSVLPENPGENLIETWRHKEITVENWHQANPYGALAGYWRLNEGSGSGVINSSGYGTGGSKLYVTGSEVEECSGIPLTNEFTAKWKDGWVAGYLF